MHFRINNLKIQDNSLLNLLKQDFQNNYDIKTETNINGKSIYSTSLPLGKSFEHSLGLLYLQSLSSMIPALALKPKKNDIVLDICSAPGSKTTLLSELMNNKGLIIANEISVDRIKTLAHNLDKTGASNVILSNKNGHFIHHSFDLKFDKILLDPPCSALGSLQDNSSVKRQKNLFRIDNLTQIQSRLLSIAARMLKTGGELVYSTCTTTSEENEEMISNFIKKFPFKIIDLNSEIQSENKFSFQLNKDLPGTIRIDEKDFDSEKFFIAKLMKTDDCDFEERIEFNYNFANNIFQNSHPSIRTILEHLSETYSLDIDIWKNYLFYKAEKYLYLLNFVDIDFSKIDFHRFGIKMASLDPKTGWRISTNIAQLFDDKIKNGILNIYEKNQLISYYNGQKIKIDAPDNNFVVVKYKNFTIGTAKIKNGFLMSQYPKVRRMNNVDFNLLNFT